MSDDEGAPEPVEAVEMSVLDALKEVRSPRPFGVRFWLEFLRDSVRGFVGGRWSSCYRLRSIFSLASLHGGLASFASLAVVFEIVVGNRMDPRQPIFLDCGAQRNEGAIASITSPRIPGKQEPVLPLAIACVSVVDAATFSFDGSRFALRSRT